jgi:phosphatidylserine/phosphatidylglycerophosphate/cardiolipin synthase-like enzyme
LRGPLARAILSEVPASPITFEGALVTGRSLYDEVIRDGICRAREAVWIATANVKELFVEGAGRKSRFASILSVFDDLAARGVEIRLLHAELPSRRFRAAFDRRKRLVSGGLKMKHCPRVHLKAVIVDGARMYIGSANLTGAGLGARGDRKRNFELGLMTEDCHLIDQVQLIFDEIWRGEPCAGCALKDLCPDPGGYRSG